MVELGLTLMEQSSVPLHYWTNVLFTVVFLINVLPSSSLDNCSSHERLIQYKPDYSFLRAFCCLCFPYLRPLKTHKLPFRLEPCVILGYCSSHHGYKFLSSSRRVYVSQNVVLHETSFRFANTNDSFFCSSSPKSISVSKPFFIPCDSFFQQPTRVPSTNLSSPYESPDI